MVLFGWYWVVIFRAVLRIVLLLYTCVTWVLNLSSSALRCVRLSSVSLQFCRSFTSRLWVSLSSFSTVSSLYTRQTVQWREIFSIQWFTEITVLAPVSRSVQLSVDFLKLCILRWKDLLYFFQSVFLVLFPFLQLLNLLFKIPLVAHLHVSFLASFPAQTKLDAES